MQIHRILLSTLITVAIAIATLSHALAAGGDWCPGSWNAGTLTCEMPVSLPTGTQIVVDDPGATLVGGSLTGNGPAALETAITVEVDGVTIDGTEVSNYRTGILLKSNGNTVVQTNHSENLLGISIGSASVVSDDNLISENSLSTSLRFVPGLGASIGILVAGSHNRIWENSTDGVHQIDIFLTSRPGIDGDNEVFSNDIAHGGNTPAIFVQLPFNVIRNNSIRLTEEGAGIAIWLTNSFLARLGLAPRGDNNEVLYNEIDGSISGQPCLQAGDPCVPASDGIINQDVNWTLIQGNELVGTRRNFRGITLRAVFNDVTSVEVLDNSVSETAGEAITLQCVRDNVSVSAVRVEGNSAENAFTGVTLSEGGDNCAVQDNLVLGNEFSGSFESGISIRSGRGTVTGNWFEDNELHGSISAFGEPGSGIKLLSFGGGITNNYFVDNDASDNSGDGIQLDGAAVQNNVFEGGEVVNNGAVGLHLIDASNNTLTNIEVTNNGTSVLEEGSASGNTIIPAD